MRLIIITTLLLMPLIGFASFPVTETRQAKIVKSINSKLPNYDRSNNFWGISSLSCALLSLILIPNLLSVVIFSILGMTLGAIGFNKKLKGLAISGFVLSLITFILLMVVASVIYLFG